MKNILLTLVLVLTVSFAFAGNEIEKASVVDVEESLEMNNSVELGNINFTNSFDLAKTSELNTLIRVYFCAVEDGHYRGEGSGSSPGKACRRARRDLRRQKRADR